MTDFPDSPSFGQTFTAMGRTWRWNGTAWQAMPQGLSWDDIQSKPSTFPPDAHNHDDRYFTETEVTTLLAGKAATSHSHTIAHVTGLQSTLDGKQDAGNYVLAGHTHAISDVTGLQTALNGKAATTHSHAIADTTGLQTALDSKQPSGSYATLDAQGKVPAIQLPSYVDDVVEVNNFASLPEVGEGSKIYVTIDTRRIYRWSGMTYIEISPSPGSTDAITEGVNNLYHTTARASAAAPVQSVAGKVGSVTLGISDISTLTATLGGKANTSHTHVAADITDFSTVAGTAAPVQSVAGKVGTITLVKNDVGLGNVSNTSDADKPVSTAQQTALNGKANTSHSHAIADVTDLQSSLDGKQAAGSYAASVHSHSAATPSTDGFMSFADKTKLDGVATGATNYTHPTGDGNLHVPATGTTNNGRVLKAGATAGNVSWGTLSASDVSAAAPERTDVYTTATAGGVYNSTLNAYQFSWVKPDNARFLTVQIVGGGGGGGSGRKGAPSTVRSGGGGGAGAGTTIVHVDAAALGATVSVTVGAGGAGGASVTAASGNGSAGAAGGDSLFGIFRGRGGGGGNGGFVGVANGGTAGAGQFSGTAGGAGAATAAAVNAPGATFVSGAGGGGGIDSANATWPASNGGAINSTNLAGTGANTSPTPHGLITALGQGAGGGSASTTGNALSGGNGGLYGGGGGGGGASIEAVGNSGAGGNGADGIVIVTTYF